VRAELQAERQMAARLDEGNGPPIFPAQALRARALAARRNRLLAMRRDGVIGDEAFHRIEEELDLAELALTGRRGSLPKAEER
jgi:CPA1 family monovalent cation:H+ antiporter